ncbi:MAG: tyrosine--tRNA ligase [Patescibacteria group bacterium]
MRSKEEKIKDLLERGVEGVIKKDVLEKQLHGTKKLRIKFGIDPTAPDLHLGHAVVLRKLRAFQDLGHKLVLIIGDFTAQIGDPTGKNKTRPPLTEKEIKANLKNYLKEAGKIIDIRKAEVHYNSKWLKKLQGKELVHLLSLVSVQQMIERDDFSKRLKAGETIRIHELVYPIMQGYDSVVVKADVECGGNDQTFNLLTGRTLMEKFNLPPQNVFITPLLEGLDGEKKMSKSLGNYIGLTESADSMFGKIMSLPDRLMKKYFELCTDLSEIKIKEYVGGSPRDAKVTLAREIVALYHDKKKAAVAEEKFDRVFSKKEISEKDYIALSEISGGNNVVYVVESGVAKSNSEARRLIQQGGLEVNEKKDTSPYSNPKKGDVLKIGKRHFFRIK